MQASPRGFAAGVDGKRWVALVAALGFWLFAVASEHAAEAATLTDRQTLYAALVAHHLLDPDRQLVHLSHVCSLKVDGKNLPVVDVQELVPGAVVPRGVNRIVVLAPKLVPVRTIEYTTELELIDEDTWHPHLYDFSDPEVSDQWGTANAMNEFVAAKSFNDPDRGVFVAPPV